jgi:hypothetical protein
MDPDSALENNLNLPSKNDKAEKKCVKKLDIWLAS